jgi:hypothetical protein
MPNLKFYFTALGQARSNMTDFLLDFYFNGFCKGRKNFFRLRGMPHNAQFNKFFLSAIPRYAT